jgi:hypothetical protein
MLQVITSQVHLVVVALHNNYYKNDILNIILIFIFNESSKNYEHKLQMDY